MIYFSESKKRFIVDFIGSDGNRARKHFKTNEEALEFESNRTLKRVRFVEAWEKYESIKTKYKATADTERRFFYLLDIFFDMNGVEFLDQVTSSHMEDVQEWLMKDHEFYSDRVSKHAAIKPQSVNRYFSSYRNFFNWCHKKSMIEKNPCVAVPQLGFEKEERIIPTNEEVSSALKLCAEKYDYFLPVFKFTFFTGMPPSSVARLQWKHIEFDRSRIVYKRLKGVTKQRTDKYFPLLMAGLTELLTEHRQHLIAKGAFLSPESFVFTNRNLSPIKAERISTVANSILKRVGSKATLYGLRHKLADDLNRANVGLEQSRQLLGHNDIRTTMNYSHQLSMSVLNEHLNAVRGDVSFGAIMALRKEGVS